MGQPLVWRFQTILIPWLTLTDFICTLVDLKMLCPNQFLDYKSLCRSSYYVVELVILVQSGWRLTGDCSGRVTFRSMSVTLDCHLCHLKPASSKVLLTFYFNVFADSTLLLAITSSTYVLFLESNMSIGLRLILLILVQMTFDGTNTNINSNKISNDKSQNMSIMWQSKTCESKYCFSSVSWSLTWWNLVASLSF